MDDKIRSELQEQFVNRVIKDNLQMGLVNFTNAAIDNFASESHNHYLYRDSPVWQSI
jgi:hypothetical protein